MDTTTISVIVTLTIGLITLGARVVSLSAELKAHINHTKENHSDHRGDIDLLNSNYRSDLNNQKTYIITELEKTKIEIKDDILELKNSHRHEIIQFTEALGKLNNTLNSININMEQVKGHIANQGVTLGDMRSEFKDYSARLNRLETHKVRTQ